MGIYITSIILEAIILLVFAASLWWLSAKFTAVLLDDMYSEIGFLPHILDEIRLDKSGCYILGPVALVATFMHGTLILTMRPIHATRKLFKQLKIAWRETLREDQLNKGWDE